MTTVSKNYPQGLPLKFQYATFRSIKISENEIFTGSLTGSEPEMTIFDRMGDPFGIWRSRNLEKVPWQKIADRRRNY